LNKSAARPSDSTHVDDYPDEAEKASLRDQFYNATIIDRIDVTEDLARFRIRCDQPVSPFQPGQYVALGCGNWEPRLRGTQAEEVPVKKARKLVRRAYSISCPMVDCPGGVADGDDQHAEAAVPADPTECLLPVDKIDYLEFYITLVRRATTTSSKPPALTPRLFGKKAGDRMVVEKKITGRYLLGQIDSDDTVLMLGTGTGEAPHNAMATTLLAGGHRGRIVVATSVRYRRDAAYLTQHRRLMQWFPNYCYLPLTTREPENIDPAHPQYVGKQYLQRLFQSGQLAELAGTELTPKTTHVFLCGNPDMIGYVPPGADIPERPGMLPLLRQAGFRDGDVPDGPGVIRFEKYW